MEYEDDKMVVVIVGDIDWQSEISELAQPTEIKQEIPDEGEVEDLMKVAEKYGEYLPCDSLEEIEVKIEKVDSGDEEKLHAFHEKYQEEHNKDHNEDSDSGGKSYNPRTQLFHKSFVEELRKKYPELRDNNSELVKMLVKIMKSVKRPHPPGDYMNKNGKIYECIKCGAQTETEPAALRHYQEKHGIRYLVCYACGVDFKSTTNLYKHEKICSALDSKIVLQARAIFLGRKGRSRPFLSLVEKKPKKSHYKRKSFPCSLCSAVFSTKTHLEAHEHLHRGERPYRCHVCPRAYTANSALVRHVQTHTNVQFICDHCGRSFKVKTALVAHMDTHLPLRKFPCHLCDRRYHQKAALNLHIDRVHLNLPPPCACQICPRRYPRMSLLKQHMKNAHGLSLMTRKMFFKALPTLTDTQVEQAKIILKSDAMIAPDISSDAMIAPDISSDAIIAPDISSEAMIASVISSSTEFMDYCSVEYNEP